MLLFDAHLDLAMNAVQWNRGRTLTSNGKGSDHGWGGNHLVMGGAVRGGRTKASDT